MNLPKIIHLTDGGAFLDGGTLNLDAVDASGDLVEIVLNQHMYAGTENPGRLLYAGEMVDVRSEDERMLLNLLETATIQIKRGPRPDTDPNYIGPPIETIEAEFESKINSVKEIRTWIVDFVRSERYVEVANHGIQS